MSRVWGSSSWWENCLYWIERYETVYGCKSFYKRVDLGAMAMKGYSAFPKVSALLESHHQIVNILYLGHSLWVSCPSVEILSVHFTVPADWAKEKWSDLRNSWTSILFHLFKPNQTLHNHCSKFQSDPKW